MVLIVVRVLSWVIILEILSPRGGVTILDDDCP